MKIDVFFGLYNNDVNAETEAYKKLHKFYLLNNIQKALLQMKLRNSDHPLIQSIIEKAIGEVEECISIKEPINPTVRLTAIGCYALQLNEWGRPDKAALICASAFSKEYTYDETDVNLNSLVNQIKCDLDYYTGLA